MADPGTALVKVAIVGASMAFTMSRKIDGPRASTTDVTLAEYGSPLPKYRGRCRFKGVPIVWSEKLREKKHERKTKGGKFEEYKYYWTGAVAIADNPSNQLVRMWMNNKLVLDLTGKGPVSPAAVAGHLFGGNHDDELKLAPGRNFRIYLGGEDQLPDPRYEAWCTERYGAASATARRGITSAVFEELPLEMFGNVPPTIDAEVIYAPAPAYLYDERETGLTLARAVFSPDGTKLLLTDGSGQFEMWDTPTRELMVSGNFPAPVGGDQAGISDDGTIWSIDGSFGTYHLNSFNPDGFGSIGEGIVVPFLGGNGVRVVGPDNYVFIREPLTGYAWLNFGAITQGSLSFTVRNWLWDGDNIWLTGNNGTNLGFYCFSGPRAGTSHLVTSPTGSSADYYCCNPGNGKFVGVQGSNWFTVDDQSWTASSAIANGVSVSGHEFDRVAPGETSLWIDWDEVSLDDGHLIRTENPNNWLLGSVTRPTYDRVNHANITDDGAGNLVWRYFDRAGNPGVTLETITLAVADDRNITDLDTSELAAIAIAGYSWLRSSGNDILEPLFDIHDVDPCPHDFGVKFRVRGSAPSALIDSTEFVIEGEDDPKRFSAPIKQDRELPREVLFTYADDTADQQQNTARFARDADTVDGDNRKSISLRTYVATPTTAQPLADRYGRRAWAERETASFALTVRRSALEPGEVMNVALDGVQHTYRLDKLTRSGLLLKTEWKRDDPRLHDQNAAAGPVMDGREPDVIFIPGPSKGLVADLPMTRDSEARTVPVLRYGAGPYLAGRFPGAIVWSEDAVTGGLEQWNQVDPDHQASWGLATNALLAPVTPWLWDRKNMLNVKPMGGTELTSATEDEVDADPTLNQFVLKSGDGWEIGQFATAVLQGDGSYNLSDFKRGRRGTEGSCGGHAAGDLFMLTGSLLSEGLGLDDLGKTFLFRVQSVGRSPTGAERISVPFAAASLKPYAPVAFLATRDPATGDWSFAWTRRTRVGGDWIGGTPIPLGEAAEAYELAIPLGGGAYRTISATSPAASWTSAEQTADFGAPQTSLPVVIAVYQFSDAVGRGFPSEAPIAA